MDRSQFREKQTWFDAENKDRSKLFFLGGGLFRFREVFVIHCCGAHEKGMRSFRRI